MSLLDNMPDSKQQGSDDDDDVDDDADFKADDDHDIPVDLLATIKYPGYSYPITNYFNIAKHFTLLMTLPSETYLLTMLPFSLAFLTYNQPLPTFFVGRLLTGGITSILLGGLEELDPPLHFLSTNYKSGLSFGCRTPISTILASYGHPLLIPGPLAVMTQSSSTMTQGAYGLQMVFMAYHASYWKEWSKLVMEGPLSGSGTNDHKPSMQLHLLKCAKCSNGTQVGDSIPVTQLRAPVNLVPCFGASADNCLTLYNSMEHALQFWLNSIPNFDGRYVAQTVDNRIKLSLLLSIPNVNDVPTMNKIMSNELNQLVTHEDPPKASQLLGHLLSQIFSSFMITLPDTWNWALPVDPTLQDCTASLRANIAQLHDENAAATEQLKTLEARITAQDATLLELQGLQPQPPSFPFTNTMYLANPMYGSGQSMVPVNMGQMQAMEGMYLNLPSSVGNFSTGFLLGGPSAGPSVSTITGSSHTSRDTTSCAASSR
ncbi:hypothetical protein EDB19DRAFT_1828727 [Suillus lakei]|nr:hypothetical protein EDB19DRAFT_1828727 [Suillus lakei]